MPDARLADSAFSWWTALRHGGLLIAPAHLSSYFPATLEPLPASVEERLRRDLTRFASGESGAEGTLLDTVLERVIGLGDKWKPESGYWDKAGAVTPEWTRRSVTGEAVKPRRVWHGSHGACLPVFVADEARLGLGRGRRAPARVVEWLRQSDQRLALLTNGRQWRITYAGLDHDAWAEADSELWFEEGHAGEQVTALRALLSAQALTPPGKGETSRLLAAIHATRRSQAELSSVLGERVRQAVELLIREHGEALGSLLARDAGVTAREVYLAATRNVMRMVVVLFAEARGLLPRANEAYHASYGLEGLRESLERAGGAGARSGAAGETGGMGAPGEGGRDDGAPRAERLRHRFGAWPRVLGLFRLVHGGSPHPQLPVPRYGGELFEPGSAGAADPVLRALHVFEREAVERGSIMPDAAVLQLITLLTRSKVRVRQGRSWTWVPGPVDFSDLSTEYIGILYEGLLEYELKRVEGEDPVVFLALGDEPALPLSRLEGMDDGAVAELVKKAGQKRRLAVSEDAEGGEESEEETPDEGEDGATGEDSGAASPDEADTPAEEGAEAIAAGESDDRREAARARALAWARRAVAAGRLVARLRSKKPGALRAYEEEVTQAARRLTARVVLPGEWYLVRFGGTRKGSGTFYTRPQLAVPTTHHGWLERRDDGLAVKQPAEPAPEWLAECVRDLPATTEDAEGVVRARLKRVVVERCIHGVDLDPLAVELARVSLWVETLDPRLPFTFLDHKVRCGNSLVGCWFDRFRDYPALAWEREGGDKGHTRATHYKEGAWTRAIKERREAVKADLRAWIPAAAGQQELKGIVAGVAPEQAHDEAVRVLEELHALPLHETEERARLYRERFQGGDAVQRLRDAMDLWCALWFWPAERLELAPLPSQLASPSDEALALARQVAAEQRFFHWELEFPDVFARPDSGFDAMLGNPPWETLQPVSKEFFSNLDPLYRGYGKQQALDRQAELFREPREDERAWLLYCARYKALGNLFAHGAAPFGDPAEGETRLSLVRGKGSDDLHASWRARRARWKGYADSAHPFRCQGEGKAYTYKLFLEQAHALLRTGGQLGFIAPSGLYTDKGSTDLRRLFLERCRWRWLFGFENRDKIFDIHRSFKFGPVIVEKGGTTDAVRTAFMRRELRDWEEGERHAIPYARAQVERFSPRTRAILEIREKRDLEILEKIYAKGVLLGDQSEDGWQIQYAQGDFNMTSDSDKFKPRPWWEERGYRPDIYGRWIKFDPTKLCADRDRDREPGWIEVADGSGVVWEGEVEDVALALYQGVMIWQFDFAAAAHIEGSGNRAVWRELTPQSWRIQPQFLMSRDVARTSGGRRIEDVKLAYRRIARTSDARTVIATPIARAPAGDSLFFFLQENRDPVATLLVAGQFGSYCYDWQVRTRLGGTNLSEFVMVETTLVSRTSPPAGLDACFRLARALAASHPLWAPEWLATESLKLLAWRRLWAITPHERLRLRCILDALVAELYGADWDDLAWILRDCDHPMERARDTTFTRALDPKGFWRVDKEKAPELRHTVLSLVAFRDLKQTIAAHGGDRDRGIQAFCAQNDGDGWMLPERVRLSDYGLGHDARAREPQPVRDRMGERFLSRQLEQSVEESWAECERHARNLLGERGYERLKRQLRGEPVEELAMVAEGSPPNYPGVAGGQRRVVPSAKPNLFGGEFEDLPVRRKRRAKR